VLEGEPFRRAENKGDDCGQMFLQHIMLIILLINKKKRYRWED
jgi:hypothetical protein